MNTRLPQCPVYNSSLARNLRLSTSLVEGILIASPEHKAFLTNMPTDPTSDPLSSIRLCGLAVEPCISPYPLTLNHSV